MKLWELEITFHTVYLPFLCGKISIKILPENATRIVLIMLNKLFALNNLLSVDSNSHRVYIGKVEHVLLDQSRSVSGDVVSICPAENRCCLRKRQKFLPVWKQRGRILSEKHLFSYNDFKRQIFPVTQNFSFQLLFKGFLLSMLFLSHSFCFSLESVMMTMTIWGSEERFVRRVCY